MQGDDGLVAASPRNCYSRNNVLPLRRRVFDESDGATMSTSGQTPIEKKATEIRRMNTKKEETHVPPPASIEGKSAANPKKSRPSTSSLASVFSSRASSPMETMRKVFGRSSSKQPKEISAPSPPSPSTIPTSVQNEKVLTEELENVRSQLAYAQLQLAEQTRNLRNVQMVSCSQQCQQMSVASVATMTEKAEDVNREVNKNEELLDKENLDPDVIYLGKNENGSDRIQSLKEEVAALKKENAEQKEEFRKTCEDFVLIVRGAVRRRDEAERKLEKVLESVSDEDDWTDLTSHTGRTLRRNALLTWVQEKIESYSDQLTVSNFSSDWTDCRAFCALLSELFPEAMPDVTISPIIGDCITRCRRTFLILEIPFDERALGISITSTIGSGADEDSSSTSSLTTGLTDWRYVMDTVFVLYKLGKQKKQLVMSSAS